VLQWIPGLLRIRDRGKLPNDQENAGGYLGNPPSRAAPAGK
jgi:hypothetical protein